MEKILLKCRHILGYALLFLLLMPAASARAQDGTTVTGVVVDENNLPVVGASVLVKNTVNGCFDRCRWILYDLSRRCGQRAGLLVPGLYAPQEVAVANRTRIDIQLLPDSKQVEEVVVVGYGVQKKESVVGAISTVDVSNLKVSNAQLSTNLAGQLAGIVSMSRSGEPGKNSAADFYIRGVSSFQGSSSPLVLVDGIERDLDLVDTDDIASFSILKDASASAVYGVRGANGVILITTKKVSSAVPK